MAFVYLIFAVAAAISGVAAYFSLVGLASIFAATFWGVVIMGASLEVGKIVTAKWIHANWRNPGAPWYFRALLCFFVACLMAITSLGIYGYLSKGHLEQQAPLAGLNIQVAQLETQLKQKQDENTRLEGRLAQIGKITDKVLEGNAKAGLRASNQSKKEAADIQKSIDANNVVINDITQKLVPLKMKTGDVQGELGVAKFIAEAAGWEPEKAIRIIISLIMAAFDPLALSMFIMGSISLKKRKEDLEAKKAEGNVVAVVTPEHMVSVEELLPTPVEEPADPEVEPFQEAIVIDTESNAEPIVLEELATEPLELKESFEEELKSALEHQQLVDDLKQAREAFEKERSEFNAEMVELEKFRGDVMGDHAALQSAHQQLLDMEARLADERELLGQWEEQLKQQQAAINSWKPERHDHEDGRDPKDMIIEVLEMNPDIVNDIVQVAMAMQNARPGL